MGQLVDLGTVSFTEAEIIEFAKAFDPLDFHISKEAAKKSYFKGIIASGPHLFNYVHRTRWIPLFGKTVICGLEVASWKFLKPLYPGMEVKATATIIGLKPDPEKKYIIVKWFYEFVNASGECVQSLEMSIMHKFL